MTNLTDTRTSDVEKTLNAIEYVLSHPEEGSGDTTKDLAKVLTSFREKVAADERERIALDVKHRLALCGHACGATQELSELLQALTPSKV